MFRRPALPSREERIEQRQARLTTLTAGAGLHSGAYGGSTTGAPVVKENALQHQGYMAAVRDLGYCMLCRRACRPQFCHADFGKGERIKTDVRRGWPGCGPGSWGPGCHWLVGSSGNYAKEERRALEAELGWRTRQAVQAAGTWPKRLALWPNDHAPQPRVSG